MYIGGINSMNYLNYLSGYGLGSTGYNMTGLNFSDVFQRAALGISSAGNRTSTGIGSVGNRTSTGIGPVGNRISTGISSVGNRTAAGLALHGKADAGTGEQIVGSFVNVQAGTSSAIYKTKDFDAANPVYHVKTWDMDGNMTERMVDLSKINPRSSDDVDMYTYSWHLNNSGQYPQAQLRFAAARAYQQAAQANSFQSYMPTKTNWVDVVNSLMQTQYNVGNLQGYLDYKKFLGFLL